jgi:membrane-associated protease RseP (regulator of RpoE activity)
LPIGDVAKEERIRRPVVPIIPFHIRRREAVRGRADGVRLFVAFAWLAVAGGCSSTEPAESAPADPPPPNGAASASADAPAGPASASEPLLRGIRILDGDAPGGDRRVSPDGTRILRVQTLGDGGASRILIAGRDGGDERVLVHGAVEAGRPAFHPDGRRVIFSAVTGPSRNRDLFLVNDDGTDLIRLTRDAADDDAPAFAPDGRRLLWTSTRWDGTPRLTAAEFVDDRPPAGRPDIAAEDARRHIARLASDDMEGRLAGSFGGGMAASYVAGAFRRFGLRPAGDGGSFLQGFEFTSEIRMGPGNALTVRAGDAVLEAKPGVDFRPVRYTGNGSVEASAVAVGYGIVLPDEDDYAGCDASGRVAVALDGVPSGWAEKHARPEQRAQASTRRKAAAASEKKASALIVVVANLAKEGERGGGGEPAALPVVRVTRAFWDRVLEKAGKVDVPLRVKLATDMVPVRRWTCNVVGVWPGEGPEAVVVGAHYDHLGYGVPGASLGGINQIHPGADDNASGVAAMLEVAQAVAAAGRPLRRTLVFAAFTGEELGFVGSSWYVERPAVPLDRTAAMINLDMVGRAKTGGLILEGAGTSPLWEPFAERLKAEATLAVTVRKAGFFLSDHSTFYARKIPTLFFFTGLHKDYHRPADTADRVDDGGVAEVARWAREAAERAASAPERPAFVEVKRGEGPHAYLGLLPDFYPDAGGLRLTGVVPGGPAAAAGLVPGDVILRVNRTRVLEPEELMRLLAELKPGEEVELGVLRGGTSMSVKVKLGHRPED